MSQATKSIIDALTAELTEAREAEAALRAALEAARDWMVSTNDYESLSPVGHALTRDAIKAATAALANEGGSP